MAHNSFLIKGWAISIVAVVLALTEKTTDNYMITAILIIPLICFWFLDAFFLQTEKKYRKMYVDVLVKRKNDNDEFLYDLNPKRYDKEVKSKIRLMFSKTLAWFYGIPLLIVIIILGFQIYTGIKTDNNESDKIEKKEHVVKIITTEKENE